MREYLKFTALNGEPTWGESFVALTPNPEARPDSYSGRD